MLRSGYTTGACAAAATKAATELLVSGEKSEHVEIPFPNGSRVTFAIHDSQLSNASVPSATASIIKDAGDDPDVTNGAEIVAKVQRNLDSSGVIFIAGTGVGTVTKPGLAVSVGEPAINPVPREMISNAISEVNEQYNEQCGYNVEISVPSGLILAEKTLNKRLGIIGGISILGTTGVVRPISASAWTATITTSMQVAIKAKVTEIVISTGRTSESAIENTYEFSEEAFVMMGDFLDFTLREAFKIGFDKIHYSGMWAKILKGALGKKNTHVKYGVLEPEEVCVLMGELGLGKEELKLLKDANTARDIFERLTKSGNSHIIDKVCQRAKKVFEERSALPVAVYLIDHRKKIIGVY